MFENKYRETCMWWIEGASMLEAVNNPLARVKSSLPVAQQDAANFSVFIALDGLGSGHGHVRDGGDVSLMLLVVLTNFFHHFYRKFRTYSVRNFGGLCFGAFVVKHWENQSENEEEIAEGKKD